MASSNGDLRVLNVIAEDRVGGPQLRILRIAQALKARGVTTIVAIPAGKGGFKELLDEASIPCRQIPGLRRIRATPNPIPQMAWLLRIGDSVTELARVIREERVDLVHQNDATQIQGALAGRLAGKKVVWHINGMTFPLIYKSFRPLIWSLAHSVVASSEAMGREFFGEKGGLFARPFDVLYPPIYLPSTASEDDGRGLREEFDIPDSAPVIGMVANLYPPKGHVYFIRAAGRVIDAYPGTRFLIVGQVFANRSRYRAKLQEETRRCGLDRALHFTGFRSDIRRVLSTLDVQVHPSLHESFGMSIAEGMAAGKAVVATAVGGTPEVLVHGESGLLVPPKDPGAIAEAVMSLLRDPDMGTSMGNAARERALSMFSAERCAAKHERVYRKVLGTGS